MARLNLGAGSWNLDGWQSINHQDHDLRVVPWPWADNSVNEILASHVLEHLLRRDAYNFLCECYRILKPGAWLHLAVPDMDKFIDCREAGDFTPLKGYRWTDLNYYMGGDGTESNTWQKHRYMWCASSLAWVLQKIGFVNITERGISPLDNPANEAVSLYMDAQK